MKLKIPNYKLLPLLAICLILEFGCEAVGPLECDTPISTSLRIVNPDSLSLVPYGLCFYSISSSGNTLFCPQDFGIRISGSDSSNALIHLDTSVLRLFVNGQSVYIPRPGYVPAPYWRDCPVYQEMRAIYVQGMLPTVMDTTVTVEIRRDSSVLRTWNLRYHFDTTQAPLFSISNTTDGLAAQILLRSGVSPSMVSFRSIGEMHPPFSFPSGSTSFTVAVRFQDVAFLNYRTDAATLSQEKFFFCTEFDSTIYNISVNGATRAARSESCQRVEGANYDWLYQYRKRNCPNCP